MARKKDERSIVREMQNALDEKDLRELQNVKLKKEKEVAEEIADITTKANKELVDSIRDINDKASVLGVNVNFNRPNCPNYNNMKECGTCTNFFDCYQHRQRPTYEPMVEKVVKEPKKEVVDPDVHPVGCHCERCCPNPNPTWFEQHRNGLLAAALCMIMLVLAIGWSPSGATFQAIQENYVNLLVDFFKMALLGGAGFIIFNIFRTKK